MSWYTLSLSIRATDNVYHCQTCYHTRDNVCLDLQNCRYSICNEQQNSTGTEDEKQNKRANFHKYNILNPSVYENFWVYNIFSNMSRDQVSK
jgi:hypothetical protein